MFARLVTADLYDRTIAPKEPGSGPSVVLPMADVVGAQHAAPLRLNDVSIVGALHATPLPLCK